MKKALGILLFFAAIMNVTALEISVGPDDEELILTEDRVITDDYFFGGKELTFNGQADDLYFIGETLRFNGKTENALTGIGRELIINGPVGNNLHIGAETVEIRDTIDGTVMIGGRNITLAQTGVINGDLLIGGNEIEINGTVNGDIKVGGGYVIIDGVVNGDAYIEAGQIQITNSGRITGDLKYGSETELKSDEQSRVSGSVTRTEYTDFEPEKDEKGGWIFFPFFIVIPMFLAGLLVLLFPCTTPLDEKKEPRKIAKTMLWGLIPFFLFPVAVMVLMIMPPVAVALGLGGMLIFGITLIWGAVSAGQLIFRLFKWKKEKRYLYFMIGMAALFILCLIPVLNILAVIAVSAMGWGNMLEVLFRKKFE